MTLTVGSLFSGIGGIDLGLERAGMKVLWQVEIDEWCRAVLAKHWPTVERFVDVRSVGADRLAPVDLIAGGFPCQDISGAGQGEGISGSRSGLWGEFARIIGELRPRYVLVENVALLKSRGLEVVLADLAALGYDAEWDCIPASAVGAPHQRDRLWLLAYSSWNVQDSRSERAIGKRAWQSGESVSSLADADLSGLEGRDRRVLQERASEQSPRARGPFAPLADTGESVRWWTAWAGWRLSRAADLARSRRRNGSEADGQWESEPNVGRVAHGVPARVDRLRGLGNAVVPQVVEWIGRRIVEAEEEVA